MQEFKKNLLDLVAQFGIACIDLDEAERNPRRDMGRHLNATRAKCDNICKQIAQQLDKVTAVKCQPQFTYKANIYGKEMNSFVIDQVDEEGNRDCVVHLKVGMGFKTANKQFAELTGMNIADVKNVCIFVCHDIEDFDEKMVAKNKMWIVTDEYGQILKIVDLT